MGERLRDGYDVAVIGGGAAGLSGALLLARARRSVVVIDAGTPRNAPAEAVHGLLGNEGIPPAELLERGRAELAEYGGHVVAGEVTTAVRDGDAFTVALADGRSVRARRLLVTTGLGDQLPDVPGLRGRWGRDVLHCPYCHGWEVRDRPIGVLGSGPMTVHAALLWRQWSRDVTLFTHTLQPPSTEEAEQLAARGIRVVDGEVASLEVVDDRLAGVRMGDGTVVGRDALAVPPRMVARAGFLTDVGLKAVEHPSGMGEHIPVDATGRTDVSGVWAAGNVTDLAANVAAAVSAGAVAAGHINADLLSEENRQAVAGYRGETPAASEDFGQAFWEERYHAHAGAHHARPSEHLVAETAELAPGRALDAGCGEGADAIWLASHGWQVTAVDFAPTALSRAGEQAEALGAAVSTRIDWVQTDLTGWTPPQERFDLVTAHYVHPAGSRDDLFRRLAAAVAPGGTLLVVGHDPSDTHTASHVSAAQAFFTAEEVAAQLGADRWDVAVAETRTRVVTGHDGHDVTVRDAVLRAQKKQAFTAAQR